MQNNTIPFVTGTDIILLDASCFYAMHLIVRRLHPLTSPILNQPAEVQAFLEDTIKQCHAANQSVRSENAHISHFERSNFVI